jgi:phosphorylase kinase alpha/beta subunit
LGDSFWCQDYYRLLRAADRTRDFSNDMATRDQLLLPGMEAQWCLFDPVISTIFGRRYRKYRRPDDLAMQTFHLNRSFAHITGRSARCGSGPGQIRIGPFKCPELYHIETVESGESELQPSEATPLLWTQANLVTALSSMERSLRL